MRQSHHQTHYREFLPMSPPISPNADPPRRLRGITLLHLIRVLDGAERDQGGGFGNDSTIFLPIPPCLSTLFAPPYTHPGRSAVMAEVVRRLIAASKVLVGISWIANLLPRPFASPTEWNYRYGVTQEELHVRTLKSSEPV